MAELTPEQIAKGYYTDISGIGTAIDKVQEQEALRAKAKQAQQDKLYQGIKDISGVFDNKYAATGTSADPILLGKINKQKNDLIEGLMSGKVSPSSAYMLASSGVADINNLAGTISQYRQNTEKKIAELKKDHPELNSEQLLNDSIKSAIYNPESGEIVAPNSNYDYASTLFNQDRLGRYTDKELLNINNQKAWKDLEGTQGYMKTGPFTYEHRMKPGQMIVPGRNGGMGVDFESLQVGQEDKENIVNKNGKAVKQIAKVGGFPGASDALLYHFEGNRGLKSAAQYELAGLDEVAKNDPEFAKKWDVLTPEDKYRVAALKYAKSNLGTGGSYIKPADLSAEAQYQLKLRELANKNENKGYVNPVVQAAQVISQNFKDKGAGIADPAKLLKLFDKGQMIIGRAPSKDDATSVRPVYGSMKSGKENGREYILVEPLSNQGLETTADIKYAGPGVQPSVYSNKKLKYYLDNQADMDAFFNNYSALNDDRSKVIEKTQY